MTRSRLALRPGGRTTARLAGRASDHLAEVVRRTPPRRIDAAMRTPARRLVLETIFWQMPARLDANRAAGLTATVRWQITGGRAAGADVYDLVIADGRAQVVRPAGAETRASRPTLTITLDAAEFLRIACGASNPVTAYFAGKLAIRGNLMQASRLSAVFRVPGPPATDLSSA